MVLDRTQHRGQRFKRPDSHAAVARMNACFVAVSGFPEVAKEYVIGFVPSADAQGGGVVMVSPVALLGL